MLGAEAGDKMELGAHAGLEGKERRLKTSKFAKGKRELRMGVFSFPALRSDAAGGSVCTKRAPESRWLVFPA